MANKKSFQMKGKLDNLNTKEPLCMKILKNWIYL